MTARHFTLKYIVVVLGLFACGMAAGVWLPQRASRPTSQQSGTQSVQPGVQSLPNSKPSEWEADSAIAAFLQKRDSGTELTGGERVRLISRIREWLRSDAEASLNFLAAHEAGGLLDAGEIVDILEQTPGATPTTLIRIAGGLEDKSIADSVFNRAFKIEQARSPLTCLSLLSALPKHLQRALEKEALKEIAVKTGPDGLEKVMNQFEVSFMAARDGIEVLAQSAPERAFDLIERNRARIDALPMNAGGANQVLSWLVGISRPDPDISLGWLRQMPRGALVDSWVKEAISLKLQREPANVDQILSSIESEAIRVKALKQAAAVLAKKHPDQAQQLIEKIPSDRARAEAYSNAGRWMILSNPTGALELAASASSAVDRARSIGFLTKTWMESDPVKALEYAAARTNDSPFSYALSNEISERLKPEDPEGSAKSLASLKDLSPEAKEAISNMVVSNLTARQRDLLSTIVK